MTTAKVYEAICNVTADLAKVGISKDRKNQQQGYNFRGIDDVYGALSPLLARHKLCILPRLTEHSVVERQTAKGGTIFYTTVRVEFDFVSAEDGSKHTVAMIGEAMDSADKSSNKAQSAAYKYAAMQAFCIPTEGDNDADAHTHQVMPARAPLDMDGALMAIREADGLDALKDVYLAAMKKATPAQQAELTDAKDTRKTQLTEKVAA